MVYSANALAEDEPLPVSALRYKAVRDATYAVSTQASPANDRLSPFMLHRLQYDHTLRFQGSARGPYDVDGYTHHYFDLMVPDLRPPQVEWISGGYGTHDRGKIAYSTHVFNAGTSIAALNPTLFENEFLLFPVFAERPETPVQQGETWELRALPFILFESTGFAILTGKFDPHTLPPTTIRSTFEGWKELDGRRCALITSAMDVKAVEPKEGMQDGEIKYRATSYFSPELGLPVVNVLVGDGFVTDRDGRKETISLRRKEVLIRSEGSVPRVYQETDLAAPR